MHQREQKQREKQQRENQQQPAKQASLAAVISEDVDAGEDPGAREDFGNGGDEYFCGGGDDVDDDGTGGGAVETVSACGKGTDTEVDAPVSGLL